MFYCTDSGLLTIVVIWKSCFKHCFNSPTAIFIQSDIFFFIHRFQLRMEQTEYRISKTLGLYSKILIHYIARNLLLVNCLFKRSKCICTFSTHGCHQFIVFISNRVFGRFTRHAVDFLVYRFPLHLVSRTVVLFIKCINLIQQRLFLGPIFGSKFIRTLKEHMFQIVSQTCMIFWIGFTSGFCCNVSLDTRFFFGWT
ncbi:hypothetical protein D3C81_1268560 [compost metagenome]